MKGLGFEVLVLEWIGVRGFGAGVDWGSRFWLWGGLGFKVLALGWIGVQGFGPGVNFEGTMQKTR